MNGAPLSICIVYDRVYPASVGGAERWYRLLAERLALHGHHVTYLTSEHWEAENTPYIPGVCLVPMLTQRQIYDRQRRRALPILAFGLAVGWHLLRHGREYDVVHTSAMLNAAALIAGWLAPRRGYRLVLDWWEVWPRRYWREYLGRAAGSAGWVLQQRIARINHQPVAYSELHAQRLEKLRSVSGRSQPQSSWRVNMDGALGGSRSAERVRDASIAPTAGVVVPILRGLLDEAWAVDAPGTAMTLVVAAGRLIREKQVAEMIPGLASAREHMPGLRAVIFGTGPDEERVRQAITAAGMDEAVELPGFVSDEELRDTLRRALCLLVLSRREGYGLIIVEAAALGTPSVVLRHPDSAASEVIVNGINGFLCESADPGEIAAATRQVYEAGQALRQRTLEWFLANAEELTAGETVTRLQGLYRGDPR